MLEHKLMIWRGHTLNARSDDDQCQNTTSLLLIAEMSFQTFCFVAIKLPVK